MDKSVSRADGAPDTEVWVGMREVMHEVTLIPGDGTGPELCDAARRCLEATGVSIRFDVQPAGAEAFERHGSVLPEQTIASIERTGIVLKGPLSQPPGGASGNALLRQRFDLFASLRVCKRHKGVVSLAANLPVDLVIVRENTEDLYAGIEFDASAPETVALIDYLNRLSKRPIAPGSGIGVKPISAFASRRVAQLAFNYARALGRRKVTAVHKANVLKRTDGLFLSVCREVAKDYSDIEFDDRVIDNVCMQLVQKPHQLDVLVMPNVYGDILADLATAVIGGLGVAPGANMGERVAVFEATHGSAPKHKGKNKVNPTALILASVMLLRRLGEGAAAAKLESAVADVIAEGRFVTYDLKPNRDDPTAVGAREMTDAIIKRLR